MIGQHAPSCVCEHCFPQRTVEHLIVSRPVLDETTLKACRVLAHPDLHAGPRKRLATETTASLNVAIEQSRVAA